ncbi:MAG TPA: PKD domain-containing protein [Saprospiraceae bacterium]|nr:PKD domain-containing protein [Saprospiraceae bacterium]HRO07786.1 PKD domain-containing protein [Saprospiraceae bacterium]HRP40988.1 PKD domain-containing protein [Saprospiraceae bacterium]
MKHLIGFVLILLIVSGCSKDDFPVPPASIVPKFTYTVNNDGFAPAEVAFSNISIIPERAGSVVYNWSFGDNNSSIETSPKHIYSEPGVYTVKLVVISGTVNEIKESSQTVVIKDPSATGTPLYFSNGKQIFRTFLNDNTPVDELLPVTIQGNYGMVFDTVANVLYIADADGGAIIRCDADGKNQVVFRSDLEGPSALTIDYKNRYIYWDTSSGIQRGKLDDNDKNQKEDFVTGQANDPEGMAIDPVNNRLYWVNYDGGLWSKNLDGSNQKELIADVEGGSIIVIHDRIYFDYYNASKDIHIKSADLEGGNVQTIATANSRVVYGIAYDKTANMIYWGDRNADAIKRASLDGSVQEVWFQKSGLNPRGLTFGIKK